MRAALGSDAGLNGNRRKGMSRARNGKMVRCYRSIELGFLSAHL